MGGTPTGLSLGDWPEVDDVVWLLGTAEVPPREDMVSVEALCMPYLDVVCSADALITKPGYGAFSEAACSGIPVLYVPRRHWPEAPFLTRWLESHARCLEVEFDDLWTDRLGKALEGLWTMTARPNVMPTGIEEAANILESRYLAQRC